jgi:hypothetical protein
MRACSSFRCFVRLIAIPKAAHFLTPGLSIGFVDRMQQVRELGFQTVRSDAHRLVLTAARAVFVCHVNSNLECAISGGMSPLSLELTVHQFHWLEGRQPRSRVAFT